MLMLLSSKTKTAEVTSHLKFMRVAKVVKVLLLLPASTMQIPTGSAAVKHMVVCLVAVTRIACWKQLSVRAKMVCVGNAR